MPAKSPIVLIVEDHQDSLAMYAAGLLAMGLEPVIAESAAEGFLRACEFHPDVVVTDVRMAGTSGLELARQLRHDSRTKDAGIIAITSDDSAKQQAREAGCDRFLVKPCPPDVLGYEVYEVLESRALSGGGGCGVTGSAISADAPPLVESPASYQQTLERIRADYQEMPGMRLTAEQVQRLCGVDGAVCRLVLDDLVRAQFLRVGPDGRYARLTEGVAWPRPRAASAEWHARRVSPTPRLAD